MTTGDPSATALFLQWVEALDARHLADLTIAEVGRALRALSSCYVERRATLAEGSALSGAGKRAAFALFYAPVHFLVARHIVERLPAGKVATIIDLGCGIGSAGAAWALQAGASRVHGVDRHPWAVAEANWTYRQFGLRGHAVRGDITAMRLPAGRGTGIIAAYAVNELREAVRRQLLGRMLEARASGARVIILEPIARRTSPWWTDWAEAFVAAGGRADEWRFTASLPDRQRQLARSAGLRPDELTARSLFMAPSS